LLIGFNQLEFLGVTMTEDEKPRIKRKMVPRVGRDRVTIGVTEVIEVDFMRSNNL
jgi:hypothetical protein